MPKKSRALGFLICGILLVLLIPSCTKRDESSLRKKQLDASGIDPVGIYLVSGTRSHAEIVRDGSGNLKIKGTFTISLPGAEWKVSFDKQKLILLSHHKLEWSGQMDSGEYYGPQTQESEDYFELLPSSTTPGDWDLVQHHFWIAFNNERFADEVIRQFKQRVPSYLHRLDDRRVVEYFNSSYKYYDEEYMPEQEVRRVFELASELLASYPTEPYVRILYLNALLRKGDYEALAERIEAWKDAYKEADNPFLREAFQFAEHALKARQLTLAGRNAYDFATELLAGDTDLASRLEKFSELLDYEESAAPIYSVAPLGGPRHFFDFQISIKVFLVEASFLMLQGQREEALQLLAASYYLGQLLNESDPTSIGSLIGSAFRRIACRGLEVYALNCCETPGEFQRLWEILEEFNRRSQKIGLAKSTLAVPDIYGMVESMEKTGTSHRRADTHFQLLRLATAAKYRFVTQKAFPRSAEEFASLLPEGLPKDPYGSDSLKFLSGPQSFTCYSVGSDEQDDRATVSYDPTNGTVSRGDIILEIPHERKYPFPSEGVRAASADELRRHFPNGLPRDIFADTRGRPLGISNTTPVYVYSYGPDVDESEARKVGDRYVPEAHYDPTNGHMSPGDLFIAIPR